MFNCCKLLLVFYCSLVTPPTEIDLSQLRTFIILGLRCMCPPLVHFPCRSPIVGLIVCVASVPPFFTVHRPQTHVSSSIDKYCFCPHPMFIATHFDDRILHNPQLNVTLVHMHNIVVDFYTPWGLLFYCTRRIAVVEYGF